MTDWGSVNISLCIRVCKKYGHLPGETCPRCSLRPGENIYDTMTIVHAVMRRHIMPKLAEEIMRPSTFYQRMFKKF